MEIIDHRFRVMASRTQVLLVDSAPGAAEFAEDRLRTLEARWSRFLGDSDISRLNTAPATWVAVAPDTITLIESMRLAAQATGGAYDPTFLHELIETGYRASIDDPTRASVMIDLPCPGLTVHDVAIDRASTSVLLPSGLALDPGGIGKGLAADLVVTELLATGTGGALVSVGGDLAAAGRAPTPEGWTVHVEDPLDPGRTLVSLAVSAGGVATSSTRSRRWRSNGIERHHVIDPATATTSTTDLAAVTVIANAGWLAEAHATGALLAGSGGVLPYLDAHGLAGIATTNDGITISTTGLEIPALESAS